MRLDDARVLEQVADHRRVAVQEQALEDIGIIAASQRAPGAEGNLGELRRQLPCRIREHLSGLGRTEYTGEEAVPGIVSQTVEVGTQRVGEFAGGPTAAQHRQCRLPEWLTRCGFRTENRGEQCVGGFPGLHLEPFQQELTPHGQLWNGPERERQLAQHVFDVGHHRGQTIASLSRCSVGKAFRLGSRPMTTLPFHAIETVFLDVGNTLVSIDFRWVARELASRGFEVAPATLRRAEAAARPAVSERAAARGSTEGESAFHFYLRSVLERLTTPPSAPEIRRLASELEPVLRVPGESDRLWCEVMSGVPEALEAMTSLGLRLVVVSNADGTVERSLKRLGLSDSLDLIIDSQVVGFEKPDPRIFELALSRSGAAPETTLHVGDLYAADVVGARSAGCHALLLDPHGDWGELDCAVLPDISAVAVALEMAR